MNNKIDTYISTILSDCSEIVLMEEEMEEDSWRIHRRLESIAKNAMSANVALSIIQIELTEDITSFGMKFHYMLGKYYDDTSSNFLHSCVDKYDHLWDMILLEISKATNGKSPIQNMQGAFQIIHRGYYNRWGVDEMGAALEFFFLQHTVEEVETTYNSINL